MRIARPYQTEAINAIRNAFRSGKRGVVIEIPTGGGKGYIIAKIAKDAWEKGKRTLIVVNRNELCRQLIGSCKEQGLWPSLECGQDHATPMSDVVVASIQTAQNVRLKKWNPRHFDLIICDEVHGSAAKTFKNTLGHFESSFHLGVTATLERHDKAGLAAVYEECVFSMTLQEAIEDGWLVPFRFEELPVPIEISDETAVKRCFTEKDEEGIFEKGEYLPRLFKEASERAAGRKALMFWPNCKSSEEADRYFTDFGIQSRHIDGYMSPDKIREILDWFSEDGPRTLHNADLLSVGYDNPSIDCVGIMRLSRSIPLLKQRLGRGTRPLCRVDDYPTPELRREAIAASYKPECIVLDLMIQLGDVKNKFADATALITDNDEEREFLRKERKKGQFTAEELANKLRMKRETDRDAMLAKLAEDAANAALRAKARADGPYIRHILNKQPMPHWKEASDGQIRYLRHLGYNGDVPSAWHGHKLITAYKEHQEKLQLQ